MVGIWFLVCFFLFLFSLCIYFCLLNLIYKVLASITFFPLCLLYYFSFSAMCSFCLVYPNKVYCTPFKKRLEKKASVPDLIAHRTRLIHNTALSLTPNDGCIPAVVMCSHDGCLPLFSS